MQLLIQCPGGSVNLLLLLLLIDSSTAVSVRHHALLTAQLASDLQRFSVQLLHLCVLDLGLLHVESREVDTIDHA